MPATLIVIEVKQFPMGAKPSWLGTCVEDENLDQVYPLDGPGACKNDPALIKRFAAYYEANNLDAVLFDGIDTLLDTNSGRP